MNNKKLGTAFEREMVEKLTKSGYWVHFISPDNRGAQPFDLIFVKDRVACVADCKTCNDHLFRLTRLEWNQQLAFDKWMACGNMEPVIFVKYNGEVKMIPYTHLKYRKVVDLDAF